jgi:alpha-galactosidase
MKLAQTFLILCTTIPFRFFFVSSWDNGAGRTPPMGWNSWNAFGCKDVNEDIVKLAADFLISTKLADVGYEYINIDDCWQYDREEHTGKIIVDNRTFPSGIKALADYIHSKGLKFGIYSDAGTNTCAGRPGSLNFEDVDALTYKEWGVDYLKYDNCNNNGISGKLRYTKMQQALIRANNSRIFYSLCSWGEENVSTWAAPIGNSWRTTGDISDNWNSFIEIVDQQQGLEKYSGPGAWNDPDMLEVGNGGMTHVESQAHFALWAILKAPLLIGCDLATVGNDYLEILSNKEVIAINQDKLGKQAKRIIRQNTISGPLDIYSGELFNNTIVVLFHNRCNETQKMSYNVSGANVRDVIRHIDYGYLSGDVSASVESHGIYLFTLQMMYQTNTDVVEEIRF